MGRESATGLVLLQNQKNASTGKTPYDLAYGKKCNAWLREKLTRGADRINEGAPPDQTDDAAYRAAEEMAGKRKQDQVRATAKQTKTNAKNKKQYDKHHQAPGQEIVKGSIA